jgi:hypothetical protein
MYMTPERMPEVVSHVVSEGEPWFNETRDLLLAADEQFCQRNRAYYHEHIDATLTCLQLPYEEAYARLRSLDKKPAEEFKQNPDATMTVMLGPATWKIYNHDVSRRTFSNALKAALEIYVIAATTGKLPDGLPAGLPKDLFSGEDFEYEKKADAFVLRCRGKDLKEDKIHEYEFKVRK